MINYDVVKQIKDTVGTMINYDVVKQIKDTVGTLLSNYAKEIEAVIAEEGGVAISVPVKIKQSGPKLDIEVGIGFVKERIKDAAGFTIEGQKELFGPDGVDLEVRINAGNVNDDE